jgi:hypothetical protein
MSRLAAIVLAALTLALTPGVTRAEEPSGGTWDSLTPDQQRRALQNYQRYQQLPEQKRHVIDERYRRFRAMPPGEQQRLRQNYETYRGQDPRTRQEFNEKYRRWKAQRR